MKVVDTSKFTTFVFCLKTKSAYNQPVFLVEPAWPCTLGLADQAQVSIKMEAIGALILKTV